MPFYLLDEVEAALDDANIGRFVELLRRYADRAQFIVVTHQKRTMEAADVLYGVTMGERRRLADRLPPPPAPTERLGRVSRRRAARRLAFARAQLGGAARRRRRRGPSRTSERAGFFSRLRDSLGRSRRALDRAARRPRRSTRPTTRRGSGSRRR